MDYINLLLGIISAIPNQLLQIPRREQMLKLVFNCLEKHTSFSNIQRSVYLLYIRKLWICVNYFNKKIFFRKALRRMTNYMIEVLQREVAEGIFKRFPHTIRELTVKQNKKKINLLNSTLEFKNRSIKQHFYQNYFMYILLYLYDSNATVLCS